ncbi:MAG: DUF4150 domain-containing protein [Candidatus Thiodiazotropha sp.]
MTITININDLTLCHKNSGGISTNTLPDVCKTPDKGVPIPYQNETYSKDLVKGTTTCFADGGNMIANLGSQFAVSVFDEAGSMGGVVSGTNKAEAEWITHSFDVFFEGKPACRLTDKLFMNHKNTVNMAGWHTQRDIPHEDLEFYDELCEMACDCKATHGPGGPLPLQDGQTYQECIRKKIDEKYYDGPEGARNGRYPKPDAKMWREVSYDNRTWDMIESNSNPGMPSSQYPWSMSRRLDVARIGSDGNPNKLIDMKFGKDSMDPWAENDYRRIAEKHTGSEENFEEFRVDDRCDCGDDDDDLQPDPVPVASPEEEKSFLDLYGEALESATGLKVAGGALVAILIVSELTRIFPARNAILIP